MPPDQSLIARRMVDSTIALRQVRSQLPVGKYLELLHIAAVTGSLPTINPWDFTPVLGLDGRPITTPVDIQDRLRILSQLVNKAVPDAKPVEIPQESHDPALLLRQDLTKLSRDALLGIIAQAGASLPEPAPEPDAG